MKHRNGKVSVSTWFLFLAAGAIGTLLGFAARMIFAWLFP